MQPREKHFSLVFLFLSLSSTALVLMVISPCAMLRAESSNTAAIGSAVGDGGQEGQGPGWQSLTLPTMALVDGFFLK